MSNANEPVGTSEAMEMPAHLQPLLKSLKNYHKSHEHSDLIIKCKDREWKVHRVIVCSQSDPIDAATRAFKEEAEGVYCMDKQDPQVVEALIHYLYNFDYGDHGNGQSDVSGIVFDVRMFIIADEYLIEPLRVLACKKFSERCQTSWITPEFAKATEELYKHCSAMDDLKAVAIDTIKQHAKEVFDGERTSEFADLVEVMRLTELGADLACMLTGGSGPGSKIYKCPSCQVMFSAAVPAGCAFTCPKGHYSGNGYNLGWWASHITN